MKDEEVRQRAQACIEKRDLTGAADYLFAGLWDFDPDERAEIEKRIAALKIQILGPGVMSNHLWTLIYAYVDNLRDKVTVLNGQGSMETDGHSKRILYLVEMALKQIRVHNAILEAADAVFEVDRPRNRRQ